MTTGPAPDEGATAPDLRRLAQDWITLWRSELAALAVDRGAFARRVTELVQAHPNVRVVREEVTDLPAPGIVATGPLT